MRCAASIVAYKNDASEILQAADCFLAAAGPTSVLHIVDHSPDERLRPIFERKNQVFYHFRPENPGFGAGHNFAILQTIDHYDLHLVLNPDIIFEPEIWPIIVEHFQENPDTGLLMPRIVDQAGHTQLLAKLLPSPADLFLKRFFPESMIRKRMSKFRLEDSGYDKMMNVPYLSGCFMLLRTSALKKVGLFDERFFMYPEDIDLTRRIHIDFHTLYFPVVSVTHAHEAASYKSLKMFVIHMVNLIKYFNKWGWFFDKERKKINAQTLERIRNSDGN